MKHEITNDAYLRYTYCCNGKIGWKTVNGDARAVAGVTNRVTDQNQREREKCPLLRSRVPAFEHCTRRRSRLS